MRGVDQLKPVIISTVQRPEAGGGRHQHNIGKGLKTADVTEELCPAENYNPRHTHLKIQKQAHTHMGLVFGHTHTHKLSLWTP